LDVDVLGARKGFHLAGISISDTISAANWLPVPQASSIALPLNRLGGNAFSGISDSEIAPLQTSHGLEFASVAIGHAVSSTNWSIVEGASNVARLGRGNTFSGISNGDGSSLQAVDGLQFTLVGVGVTICAAHGQVVQWASDLAFVSSGNSHEEEKQVMVHL
jgi:hypothetical protein